MHMLSHRYLFVIGREIDNVEDVDIN